MSIEAIGSATNNFSARDVSKTLKMEDFLKMVTIQVKHQNPMDPMTDMSFMGEMSKIMALEESRQTRSLMSEFIGQTNLANASNYMGKSVTVVDKDGDNITGTVKEVSRNGKDISLKVNDVSYPLSSVIRLNVDLKN